MVHTELLLPISLWKLLKNILMPLTHDDNESKCSPQFSLFSVRNGMFFWYFWYISIEEEWYFPNPFPFPGNSASCGRLFFSWHGDTMWKVDKHLIYKTMVNALCSSLKLQLTLCLDPASEAGLRKRLGIYSKLVFPERTPRRSTLVEKRHTSRCFMSESKMAACGWK